MHTLLHPTNIREMVNSQFTQGGKTFWKGKMLVNLHIGHGKQAFWEGRAGLDFALSIGRRRRHMICRFVKKHTCAIPVIVTLKKVKEEGDECCCHFISHGVRKIGYVHRGFFIVMDFDNVIPDVIPHVIPEEEFIFP